MADIRTLKLNLLADTANFRKGLNGARKASDTFAGRVGLSLNKATVAFAALTGAAYGLVRVGQQLVDAAAEDQASQTKLAKALKNTTKATDAQIASTEKWITMQQRSTGYTDTQLRASLARLTNSTKNVSEAQRLLGIAMDVSRGTGKDLETVTMAIGKAYDGNVGALKRLGVPLDDNILKTQDSQAAIKVLSDLYGGQASAYAETFAGKMAILNTTFGEFKEKIGQKLIDGILKVLPYVQDFADELAGTGKSSLASAMSATAREAAGDTGAKNLAQSLVALAKSFTAVFDALFDPKAGTANDRLNAMADALNRVANGINAIANGYKRLKDFGGKALGLLQIMPGEYGSFSESRFGKINGTSTGKFRDGPSMGGTTIVMNGIVDGESARRSIERVIQQSSRRSGAVNWNAVLT